MAWQSGAESLGHIQAMGGALPNSTDFMSRTFLKGSYIFVRLIPLSINPLITHNVYFFEDSKIMKSLGKWIDAGA